MASKDGFNGAKDASGESWLIPRPDQWRYTSPEQNWGLALIVGGPLVAAIFTGIRFLDRFHHKYGVEDYLLVLATLFSFTIIYPSWRMVKLLNFGIHVYEADPRAFYRIEEDEWHKLTFCLSVLSTPVLPLVKASILWLLFKIGGVIPSVWKVLWALFIFNALTFLVPLCFLVFQCPQNPDGTWEPRTFGNAHCLGRYRHGYVTISQTILYMTTDILILPIPVYLAYKIRDRTSWKGRALVIVLFFLTLGVTALGCLKVYFSARELRGLKAPVVEDWTFEGMGSFVVQHAENTLAVIVPCLPNLRVFGRVYQKFRGRETPPSEITEIHGSDSSKVTGTKDSQVKSVAMPNGCGVYRNESCDITDARSFEHREVELREKSDFSAKKAFRHFNT